MDKIQLPRKAVRNALSADLKTIGTARLRCVIPLFREISGVPDQRGCAFLVTDGPHHFIVSAGHVLRELEQGVMFFSLGGNTIRHVSGKCICASMSDGSEDDDKLDIGAVLLEGDDLPPYPGIQKEPVPMSDLRTQGPLDPKALYHVVGFPASKGGRKKSSSHYAFQPYSFTNILKPTSFYSTVGLDPTDHLLIAFNRKRGVGQDTRIQAFPDPAGMSGSPVFLLNVKANHYPIVGIATYWDQPRRVIRATNISHIFPVMRALIASAPV